MDYEWEDRFRDLGLTMKPSDYCAASARRRFSTTASAPS